MTSRRFDAETRATQLENVLRAIVDTATFDTVHGAYYEVDVDTLDEARALLDGEGAPADTGEEPDA